VAQRARRWIVFLNIEPQNTEVKKAGRLAQRAWRNLLSFAENSDSSNFAPFRHSKFGCSIFDIPFLSSQSF
jgi:hypothetical protein